MNEQIGHEFSAEQQYVAIAVHYDAQSLPRLASLFYKQAVEERNHALMMVRYLLDRDAAVKIPGVKEPRNDFGDVTEAIALSLEQEKRVGDAIEALAQTARDEKDYYSEQFMFWFLKEQVEEVATMSSLLKVAERSSDYPERIEEYHTREFPGGAAADPTAPPVAGGGA
jgi:ferritin